MIRFDTPGLSRLARGQGRLGLICGLLMALLLAGCSANAPETSSTGTNSSGQPQAGSSPVKKEGDFIVAEPNPVPAGPGVGTTKISWGSTQQPADLHIYVVTSSPTETIFAEAGGPGSQDAPWIVEDTKYEFRLYSGTGDNRKLLDKVVVTRQK